MLGRLYYLRLITIQLIIVLISTVLCGCSASHREYYGKTERYTVMRGDTLSVIASRYASSIDQLSDLNDLDDPDILEPGQALIVPAGGLKSSGTSGGGVIKASRRTTAKQFQPTTYLGGQLLWPVSGGNLISTFGPRQEGFHDGLDISAPTGTPIYAAHDGVVMYSDNELSGYGELVIVKSTSSLISIYAHTSRRLVSAGQKVKRGDLIAEVGATGRASGPHLHFEVRVKDKVGKYAAVDPAPLLKSDEKPTLKFRINESLSPLIAKLSSWSR